MLCIPGQMLCTRLQNANCVEDNSVGSLRSRGDKIRNSLVRNVVPQKDFVQASAWRFDGYLEAQAALLANDNRKSPRLQLK